MNQAQKKEICDIVERLIDARLDLENLQLQWTADAMQPLMPPERGEAAEGGSSEIAQAINSIDSALNDLETLIGE
jgi:hypothetical protein